MISDAIIAAALAVLSDAPANSAPPAPPSIIVFQCSFGVKQARVTAVGERLVYTFGSPAKAEMVISGDRTTGNVRYHRTLFAHAEHQQLRFRKGVFSYVLCNRWSSPDYRGAGAEDSSGLLVVKGDRRSRG